MSQAADTLPPSRRTVTILFVDVVGSTELSESLDPELLRPALGAYFAACRTTIEHHGGTVEKFIGDAVMAVFGYPSVHEDDALRAIRAALDLAVAVRAVADAHEATLGTRLSIRTGIQTGSVLVGGGAPGEPFATGDPVNTAARLQAVGRPGDIVLGDGTLRLVQGVADVEPLPSVELKGRSRPVSMARLLGLRRGPDPMDRGSGVLVGRAAELEQLAASLDRAIRANDPRATVIVGEPGVGKSSLVATFLATQGGRAQVARARIAPYGQATFAPLGGLLRDLGRARPPQDPEVAALEGLRSLLTGTSTAAEIEGHLASLLGLRADPVRPEEIAWAVRTVILAAAARTPVLISIEDLHWAEPGLVRLVSDLAASLRGPVLVVVTTRPDDRLLLGRATGWDRLDLGTLDPADAATVLEASLGAPAAPALRARLAELSSGNPLFLEQMVATLRDEGRVVFEDGTWRATDPLGTVSVPATVEALVAARLDRLDPDGRSLLERIATGGNELERELVDDPADDRVGALVARLTESQLLGPTVSHRLAYRHALVRDAVYGSIAKRRRADLHLDLARRLQAGAGDPTTDRDLRIGHHLEAAVTYRRELRALGSETDALAAEASRSLAAAGRRAYAATDMPGAAGLLGRATDLLPDADPARAALLPDLGKARLESGDDRALATIEEAVERTAAAGLDREHAHARLHRYVAAVWFERSVSGQEERGPLESIARDLERQGDARGAALAWAAAAEVGWFTGDIAAAVGGEKREGGTDHKEGRKRGLGGVDVVPFVWSSLGGFVFFTGPLSVFSPATEIAAGLAKEAGDPWAWREYLALSAGDPWVERSVPEAMERLPPLMRDSGEHPVVAARVLPELGMAYAARGELAKGQELAHQGLRLAGEVGLRIWECELSCTVAYLEARFGSPEVAVEVAARGVAIAETMGDRAHLAGVGGSLAMACAALQRDKEAVRWARLSHECRPSETSPTELYWMLPLVDVELRAGRVDAADRLAERARVLVAGRDGDLAARTELALARVRHAQGRAQEASVLRGRARTRYGRLGYTAADDDLRR